MWGNGTREIALKIAVCTQPCQQTPTKVCVLWIGYNYKLSGEVYELRRLWTHLMFNNRSRS